MNILLTLLTERIEREIKHSLAPLPIYLRKLGIGVAVLLVSSIGWIGALSFLILAFFWELAHLYVYVEPALWTTLLCIAVSLLLTLVGLRQLRAPR